MALAYGLGHTHHKREVVLVHRGWVVRTRAHDCMNTITMHGNSTHLIPGQPHCLPVQAHAAAHTQLSTHFPSSPRRSSPPHRCNHTPCQRRSSLKRPTQTQSTATASCHLNQQHPLPRVKEPRTVAAAKRRQRWQRVVGGEWTVGQSSVAHTHAEASATAVVRAGRCGMPRQRADKTGDVSNR